MTEQQPAAPGGMHWAVAAFPVSREGDWLMVDLAPHGS
jgi:hypothetical protein